MATLQSRFDAGEDVAQEMHGLLSRWLFNHIRNEDHGYVDAVQAYARMTGKTDREALTAKIARQMATQPSHKGWLARLFGR